MLKWLCLHRNGQSATPSWFSKLYLLSALSLFSPIQSFIQLQSSHLFISVTITTTNVLTDSLALQWEVKPQRERVRGREREREERRERQSHPPKNLAPINVHYVPRSCEMLDFQYNLAILSWFIHSFTRALHQPCSSDCAVEVMKQTPPSQTHWPLWVNLLF